MPTIPRASDTLLGTRPLPDVRTPTNIPSAAVGVPAPIDLSGVERHVQEIATDARRKADEVAFTDADAKASALETHLLYDPDTGALNQRGKNAFGLPETVGAAWMKGMGEIAQGLSTDQQRAAFQRAMVQRTASVNQVLQRHVAGEMKSYDQDATQSYVENEHNAAIANYQDPGRVQLAVDRQQAVLQAFGRRNGFAPEQIQKLVETTASKTHVSVIDRLLAADQDRTASAYFADHKDAIVGDDATQVSRALDEGSLRGESQRQADAITAKTTTMTDALAAVKAIDDPKVRDATESRVRQFWSEKKLALDEHRTALFQQASNIVESSHDSRKVPPAMWLQFSIPERDALEKRAEQLQKGLPAVTNWTTYYDLKSLASADATKDEFLKTNLLALRPSLADGEFKELTDLQASIRTNDGKAQQQLGGYRTVNQVVEQALAEQGIRTAGKTTSDERERAALFRRSVDVQIQALEGQTGKKATDADAQRIVDNLLVKGLVAGSGVFGRFQTERSVYERRPGEQLTLSARDVPAGERARIEATLRANNLPVTDAAVIHLYAAKVSRQPTLAPPDR